MKFTEEQIKTIIEELRTRAEKVKEYSSMADTMREELVFIGHAEAYEQLAAELEERGFFKWD